MEFWFNKAALEQGSSKCRLHISQPLVSLKDFIYSVVGWVHPLGMILKVTAACVNLPKFSFYPTKETEPRKILIRDKLLM